MVCLSRRLRTFYPPQSLFSSLFSVLGQRSKVDPCQYWDSRSRFIYKALSAPRDNELRWLFYLAARKPLEFHASLSFASRGGARRHTYIYTNYPLLSGTSWSFDRAHDVAEVLLFDRADQLSIGFFAPDWIYCCLINLPRYRINVKLQNSVN